MSGFVKSAYEFLESKTGILLVGFLVTTVGGAILSDAIQTKKAQNDHEFEMYKVRLAEAKALQEKLLASSNARAFYLHQVVAQLANPSEHTPQDIERFWEKNIEPSKDEWNKDLYFFHAQARVLFSHGLADALLAYDENMPILHDSVLERLDEVTYQKTKPRSLHGTFVAAHATAYHLPRKCDDGRPCDRAKLLALVERQLNDLEIAQGCLAYRLSEELLHNPYGPRRDTSAPIPAVCTKPARSFVR